MNKLIELLRLLAKTDFFGELTIKFENGKIVHVTKKQTLNAKEFRDG
jgi:hypothetical protein